MKEKWKKKKKTIAKTNKTKSLSFEKINKIEKSLPRLIKKKESRIQSRKKREAANK